MDEKVDMEKMNYYFQDLGNNIVASNMIVVITDKAAAEGCSRKVIFNRYRDIYSLLEDTISYRTDIYNKEKENGGVQYTFAKIMLDTVKSYRDEEYRDSLLYIYECIEDYLKEE